MNKAELINSLARKFNHQTYLEIGIGDGYNFKLIECPVKVGVDPEPVYFDGITVMTSDEFFLSSRQTFDIVFVDGLHEAHQVEKDVINSLEFLNAGGTIICHDLNPSEEIHQVVPRMCGWWNGDCWKAWVKLRSERDDLEMFVVDTDCGCGIIRAGTQKKLQVSTELTWSGLVANRQEWLNLISVDQFRQWLSST